MENEQQSSINQSNQSHPINIQQSLPNATTVLVLGILSIVTCWCWGLVGIIMSVIALVLYNRDMASYNSNPSMYTSSSLSNLKAGRVTAIIGLILSIVSIIFYVIYIVIIGAAMTLAPWDLYNV